MHCLPFYLPKRLDDIEANLDTTETKLGTMKTKLESGEKKLEMQLQATTDDLKGIKESMVVLLNFLQIPRPPAAP